MYEFFRHGVRLELRPLKGQRKGPASGEAAGPGRKMPMPWWRAWGRDLRGREEKAPRLGGICCWPVCRPFLKESFTSCKEVAGLLREVTPDGQVLRADLPPEVTRYLDGTRQYVVTLMATEVELQQVDGGALTACV
jgi:hypothetical protein